MSNSLKQCNIKLPAKMIDAIKAEAHRLTGLRRGGLSDLMAICIQYGWAAYQRGEFSVEREPRVLTYRIVVKEAEDTQC